LSLIYPSNVLVIHLCYLCPLRCCALWVNFCHL